MTGHLKGPHTFESECRYDQGVRIGDPGAEYEFDIKLPVFNADMTDAEFDLEARIAIRQFKEKLTDKYSWIGRVGQTGRSGGWLLIKDEQGKATKAKLQTIINMVTAAKKAFVKRLERDYPRWG